jgi:hypothetical protein
MKTASGSPRSYKLCEVFDTEGDSELTSETHRCYNQEGVTIDARVPPW